MIQFNIKTQEGTKRVTSPASWRELTLRQLIQLETEWDKESPVQLFSIITGIEVELLENSAQAGLENTMLAICAFAYDQPQWDNMPRPKYIQLGDTNYETPDNISKKLLGQKIIVSQIVLKSGEDMITQLPRIIAVYMQKEVDGKYNDKRLAEVEEMALGAPAMDAYGLGKFFFLKSVDLINTGQLSSEKFQPTLIPMERLLNGLQRLKGSEHTPT